MGQMVENGKNTFEPRGDLRRFVLADLLIQIFERRLSARMHAQSDQGVAWIQFQGGFPVAVQVANAELNLGMILRENGSLDDQEFNAYLMQVAKKGKSHLEVLLEMGVAQEQVDRGLATQLIRRINELFSWHAGTYWFEEGGFESENPIKTKQSPFELVYNGIKNAYQEEDLEVFMQQRLAGRTIRVSQPVQNIMAQLQLPDEEGDDIGLLAEFRSVDAYLEKAKSGTNAALLLLFILDRCGLLDLGDKGAAKPIESAAEEAADSLENGHSANELPDANQQDVVIQKLRQDLKSKVEQIKENDLFGLLDTTPQADLEEIKKSFVKLTKKYHPDRVVAFYDQDLQNVCSFVFGKISEAYALLSNPKTRSAMVREAHIKSDGRIDPDPEEALLEYEKARVYLNKKNPAQAAEHFYLASRLNPDKADYRAHYIWYDAFSNLNPPKEKLLQAKQQLSNLFHDMPGNFYVNRYLSLLFKRLGDEAGYAKHLKKANYINPNDIETARELRLLNLRKEKQSKRGGLSLFKKSKR